MLFKNFSKYLEKLENTPSRLEMMYQLSDLFKVMLISDLDSSSNKPLGIFLNKDLNNSNEISTACYLMQGNLVPRYLSLEFQLSVKMVIRSLLKLEENQLCNSTISVEDDTEVGSSSENKNPEETSLFGDLPDTLEENNAVSTSQKNKELKNIKQLTKEYKKLGDVGDLARAVVEKFHQNNKLSTELSILEVHQALKEIAIDSGSGSQDRKVDKLAQLLMSLDEVSAKFVARVVIGKLRLGFSAMTMLDALSWSVLENKDHRNLLESAYQKKADVGELAKLYLKLANKLKVELNISESVDNVDKFEGLSKNLINQLNEKYSVEVGVPVVPALCQRLNSSEEIIEKMGEVIAEPKYDGLRVQIHYSKFGFITQNGLLENVEVEDIKTTNAEIKNESLNKGLTSVVKIKAFTRNLEDVSYMFPELERAVDILKCDSCILDSEAIGFDPKTGELVEFQKTMKRKRKHNISETAKEVPIRFYVFDVLEIDKESKLDEPLQTRKDLLKALFVKNEVFFDTDYITTSDSTLLRSFHEQQLTDGLEGAVMKKSDSTYIGGRKGWSWVKIKESEGSSGKLSDTLDLIVMGYYAGRGKRSQFGIGAVLVGVMDDKENIKTIAKIGTGLSEKQLVEMKKMCDKYLSEAKPNSYQVHKNLIPDVWVNPEIVIEAAADELTKSPTHSVGVALRFPRVLGFRKDKDVSQATKEIELVGISHLK